MSYGFKIEVWGDYALFNRAEFKVERVSYDIITPSAARGLIESVYFKPAILWKIDRIHVYNKPEFTNIRRNEVSVKASSSDIKQLIKGNLNAKGFINTSETIQQRASMVLKNVRYVIEAHFEMTDKVGESDTVEKHYNIALRRLRKGQFFHMPYLGCREFPANFRLIEGDIEASNLLGERDLGFMLYDIDFSDKDNLQPMFYRPQMVNGIVDLTNIELMR